MILFMEQILQYTMFCPSAVTHCKNKTAQSAVCVHTYAYHLILIMRNLSIENAESGSNHIKMTMQPSSLIKTMSVNA